jgi:hypothetical protein
VTKLPSVPVKYCHFCITSHERTIDFADYPDMIQPRNIFEDEFEDLLPDISSATDDDFAHLDC